MSAEPDVGTQPRIHMIRRGLLKPELFPRFKRLAGTRGFWPVAAGVAAFALVVSVLGWAAHDRPMLRLELAFSKDACCSMQVWVNGNTSSDISVFPIQWGRTATYSVPLHTSRISRLRMPLGDVSQSLVVVRRIWVTRGSRTIDQVDLTHSGAVAYDARQYRSGGGVAVRATGKKPFLEVPVSLDMRESRLHVFFASVTSDPLRYVVEILLVGAILTALFGLTSSRQIGLIVSLALTFLAVRALVSLTWHLHLQDHVASAVSKSSYLGVAKTRERFLLELTAVAALVMSAAAALVARTHRRDWRVKPLAIALPPPRGLSRRIGAALIAFPILLVAIAAVPNLRAMIGASRTLEYVPAWDSNNLIFWQYLINKTNLVPMKDFFWPYGFQWLFDLAAPWGIVISYATYLTFWAYLAIGSYFALSRFFSGAALVRRFVLVTSFWLSAELSGYAPFATRYVAPLAVVLLFAAIDKEDGLRSWKRVVFAIAFLELALFEVAQAAYAIVPIAFLLFLELALQVKKTRPELFRWLLRGTMTVGPPLAVAAAVMSVSGVFGATASYYAQLDALWYAWPSPIDHWVSHPNDFQAAIFWAVPVTMVLGTYGLFVRGGRPRLAYGVVVALGLLGLMVMQKQVLRPPIETQMWLPPVFGLVFWAAVETSLHSIRRWMAISALGGLLAALVLVAGGFRVGWNALAGGPDRFSQSVGALLNQRDEFVADAHAQFAAPRFDKFVQYKPVVRALRRSPSVRAGAPVWILGDDSPITMMLAHSWPYYFSDLYDTSAIAFQKKVIRRLGRTPPAKVVWNFAPDANVFDSVPNVVRVPLLFQWAVRHLAPEMRIGQIEILRPLRLGEPAKLAWWRHRLGATVDLGRIPEVASSGGRECSSGDDCGKFVVVDLPAGPSHPEVVRILITVAGLRFTVQFATSSASHYVVPLDRLWFWTAYPTGVRSVDVSGPGIRVIQRTRNQDVLY